MKAARKLCLTHSAVRPTYHPGPLCQSPTPGSPYSLPPSLTKKPSPSPLLGVGEGMTTPELPIPILGLKFHQETWSHRISKLEWGLQASSTPTTEESRLQTH